jgi:hypothetical protein
MQPHWKIWLIASLMLAWPLSAGADDNEAAKVVSECGVQDLPQSSVDSCLERVRVLEETNASADLQNLETTLERRASGKQSPGRATANAEPASRLATKLREATTAHGVNGPSDESAASPDSRRLAGVDAEDQPPVADSDDAPRLSDGDEPDNFGDPE